MTDQSRYEADGSDSYRVTTFPVGVGKSAALPKNDGCAWWCGALRTTSGGPLFCSTECVRRYHEPAQ